MDASPSLNSMVESNWSPNSLFPFGHHGEGDAAHKGVFGFNGIAIWAALPPFFLLSSTSPARFRLNAFRSDGE